MDIQTFIIISLFIFIVGLCIGSFLNVVILRALSEESIVFPASKCPKCQTPLKWWHNIPVISYILLRGKCAYCKEHISIQYPIIELFTGIILVLLFAHFGVSINTLYAWVVASILIVFAGTDIKEKVIFDLHAYVLIGVGLLYSIYATVNNYFIFNNQLDLPNVTWFSNPIVHGLLGLLAGVLIIEIIARMGYLLVNARIFGEGDTLIAAGLGMVFGWQNLLLILLLSVVIQVLIFVPIFIKNLVKEKNMPTLISFILFLLLAVLNYILQNIASYYDSLLYMISIFALAISGIVTCIFILRDLRNKPADRTYLPFGPAMVFAALIVMFML